MTSSMASILSQPRVATQIDLTGRGFTAASLGSAIKITHAGTDTYVSIGADTIALIGVDTALMSAAAFKF